MKRARRLSILLGLVCMPLAHAALEQGSPAPDFEADASLGGEPLRFSLAEALQQGPVVVYFYPAAFTPGCTVEAHLFAEASDEFAALGARVIGVSGDDIDTLHRFSVSECRSRFAVAADPDLRIARDYDAVMAGRSGYAARVSYVIAPDGHILSVLDERKPAPHIDNARTVLERWRAGQAQ